MFQALIDQAYDMIQRLYTCAEKGRNEVPLAVAIRYSEYEAWETTAYGIISTVFGPDSTEVGRWRALSERRSMLLVEARRNDLKRGEFFGLIDYFNLAAGVLREYEAAYQHDKIAAQASASNMADTPASTPSDTPTDLAPLHAQEPPRQPASADQVDQAEIDEPDVARRVAADRWDVIISLNDEVYTWLADMAATREPTSTDGSAVARLAATIIERVVTQTQRSRARGELR